LLQFTDSIFKNQAKQKGYKFVHINCLGSWKMV
jgi:hypothetical protein